MRWWNANVNEHVAIVMCELIVAHNLDISGYGASYDRNHMNSTSTLIAKLFSDPTRQLSESRMLRSEEK